MQQSPTSTKVGLELQAMCHEGHELLGGGRPLLHGGTEMPAARGCDYRGTGMEGGDDPTVTGVGR